MKEIKNINHKNIKKITKFTEIFSTDVVTTFVLDSLTKFFTGDSKATYIGQGAAYFMNADDFQLNVRKTDYMSLEKEVIEVMM